MFWPASARTPPPLALEPALRLQPQLLQLPNARIRSEFPCDRRTECAGLVPEGAGSLLPALRTSWGTATSQARWGHQLHRSENLPLANGLLSSSPSSKRARWRGKCYWERQLFSQDALSLLSLLLTGRENDRKWWYDSWGPINGTVKSTSISSSQFTWPASHLTPGCPDYQKWFCKTVPLYKLGTSHSRAIKGTPSACYKGDKWKSIR